QDMTVFLTANNIFLEKGERGSNAVPVVKDCVSFEELNTQELHNLWLSRNYKSLLVEQAKRLNLDMEETALIYGEINLPTYGKPPNPEQFVYNEQLGLTKK
ncbi:MAG: hypothetical protein KAT04_03485, partial [Methylococcales bacterium]|nr:hypothetical protein [Methylococcales bacterium]